MRPSLVATFAALTVIGSGCARVAPTSRPAPPSRQPPPESPSAPVVFGGTVTFGRQQVPLVLELRSRRPPKQDATLRIPAVSMVATGEGAWSDGRLRLTLSYGDGCPGTVQVDARVTDRSGEGTLSAHDCTGAESGPLVLVRRVADDAPGASVR